MNCNKILLFLFLLLATCGTSKSAKYDVLKYSSKEQTNIEQYMVKLESYTTNGSIYHKKYKPYLIGVARIILEEKKIQIAEESIGFYFDKRESDKTRLYLGVDIKAAQKDVLKDKSYEANARKMMRIYLEDILEVLASCGEVMSEDDIYGMVIGMHWGNSKKNFINIWISEDDVKKYYDRQLTFRQLVIRSTVTDSRSKIIRLTL